MTSNPTASPATPVAGRDDPARRGEPAGDGKSTARARRIRIVLALVWCAVVARLVALTAGHTVADLDMYHEMALAREAFRLGHIPTGDPFSYMPTLPRVVHHEWGTGMVLYLLAVVGGTGGYGVMALRLALLLATGAAALWAARLQGARGLLLPALTPVALVLVAPGMAPARAQLFSFCLLAAMLAGLELDRRGHRWWIPGWLALYVLWLNLHAGFLLGAGLFAVATAERFGLAWRETRSVLQAASEVGHLLLTGGAMAVLLLANPYGWRYAPYLLHGVTLDRALISEWAPLWDPAVSPLLVLLFLLSLLFWAYGLLKRRGYHAGLVVIAAAGIYAVQHQRLLPFYAIVWLCYVPPLLAMTPFRTLCDRILDRKPAVVAAAAIALILTSGVRAVRAEVWRLRVPAVSEVGQPAFPLGAIAYLKETRWRGNLMTLFDDGAYVSWHLYPAVKVGMDSRYEVAYPAGALEQNVALYMGRGEWRRMLVTTSTDAILVPRRSPLDTVLARAELSPRARWVRVYSDPAYSIFADEANAARLPKLIRGQAPSLGRFP